MGINLSRGVIGLVLLPFTFVSASPQPLCPSDLSPFSAGGVFLYQGQTIVQLTAATALEGRNRTALNLFYVVNASPVDRRGIIVIKTARYGVAINNDTPPNGRVRLERRDGRNTCKGSRPAYSGSVSTEAYGEYHDLGQDHGTYLDALDHGGTALQALTSFHTAYETSTNCRNTDDKVDANNVYEARNNRSQFSFDQDRVDFGLQPAIYNIASNAITPIWTFFFPPALAGAGEFQLREKRVEIKPYATKNGLACVPFSLAVRGSAQMLRVNDLEARDGYNNRVKELRLGYVQRP
jgi:hypothetical protein